MCYLWGQNMIWRQDVLFLSSKYDLKVIYGCHLGVQNITWRQYMGVICEFKISLEGNIWVSFVRSKYHLKAMFGCHLWVQNITWRQYMGVICEFKISLEGNVWVSFVSSKYYLKAIYGYHLWIQNITRRQCLGVICEFKILLEGNIWVSFVSSKYYLKAIYGCHLWVQDITWRQCLGVICKFKISLEGNIWVSFVQSKYDLRENMGVIYEFNQDFNATCNCHLWVKKSDVYFTFVLCMLSTLTCYIGPWYILRLYSTTFPGDIQSLPSLSIFNSLAAGGCFSKFKLVIFKVISMIDVWRISCEIALRWMPQDLIDD